MPKLYVAWTIWGSLDSIATVIAPVIKEGWASPIFFSCAVFAYAMAYYAAHMRTSVERMELEIEKQLTRSKELRSILMKEEEQWRV